MNTVETDLNGLVADTVGMLNRVIGEEIEIRFQPSEDLWKTNADPIQVGQVIMNLALNARDAMPGGGSADSDHPQRGPGSAGQRPAGRRTFRAPMCHSK